MPSPVYCPIAVTKESNQSNDVLIRIINSILFGSLIYALTPKTKHEKFPKYYGGREVISERLAKASFSAKMLVSIDSTGLSFGVLQNIPIIMIYSDELDQNKIFRTKQNYHANQLGVSPININNNFNEEEIKKNLIINKDKYFNFKYKYLTSRNDFKTNYQILSDINAHK